MAKAGDGKPRSDMRRATHRLSKRVTDEVNRTFEKRVDAEAKPRVRRVVPLPRLCRLEN
jgi:hypothetical protein